MALLDLGAAEHPGGCDPLTQLGSGGNRVIDPVVDVDRRSSGAGRGSEFVHWCFDAMSFSKSSWRTRITRGLTLTAGIHPRRTHRRTVSGQTPMASAAS